MASKYLALSKVFMWRAFLLVLIAVLGQPFFPHLIDPLGIGYCDVVVLLFSSRVVSQFGPFD